jgi:hypothetical protein
MITESGLTHRHWALVSRMFHVLGARLGEDDGVTLAAGGVV